MDPSPLRRRATGTLLTLLALCCEVGCGQKDDSDSTSKHERAVIIRGFDSTVTLLDAQGNVANSFDYGRPITMRLTVTNMTAKAKDLSFSSAYQFDFSIRDAVGGPIWKWSQDKGFTQALTQQHFEGRETKTFDITFQPSADQPLSPGYYTVRGWLAANIGLSPEVELTIRGVVANG
jgi:hypothetical protein